MFDQDIKNENSIAQEQNSIIKNAAELDLSTNSALNDIVACKTPFELYEYLETLPESQKVYAIITLLMSPDNANFSSMDAERLLNNNNLDNEKGLKPKKLSDYGATYLEKKAKEGVKSKTYKNTIKELNSLVKKFFKRTSETSQKELTNIRFIVQELCKNLRFLKILARNSKRNSDESYQLLIRLINASTIQDSGKILSQIFYYLKHEFRGELTESDLLDPLIQNFLDKLEDINSTEAITQILSQELCEHPKIKFFIDQLVTEQDLSGDEKAMTERMMQSFGSGLEVD